MKRAVSFALALMLALSCFFSVGYAAVIDPADPMASPTLGREILRFTPGDSSGQIKFNYQVIGKGNSTSIGISQIEIHKESGAYVTTIYGNAVNGLLTSGYFCMGTYTYDGESGESYYAYVTFYAELGGVSDSVTIQTDTITAPI